jgi:DNA gyrase subunit A
MRYTEARLTKIAEEMLSDIEQNTVDWRDNFDGSLQEPVMLPTKFPNHLCNGTMGIAVGMATNMPPHNLIEVLDACQLLLDQEGKTLEDGTIVKITVDDIMEIIKGPDFPTGGFLFDSANIKEVYRKGKGGIVTRGKTHVENGKHGNVLVIDEIPYVVNKSTLVSKIGELVVDKKIDGVTDIRDESSKNIIRIAIYLKPGVDPDQILIQLYKFTELQTNFNVNNVTLIE